MLSAMRTCSGKLFHDFAAATLKARSPNFKRVLGTWKSDLVAERRTVTRDVTVSKEKKTQRSSTTDSAPPSGDNSVTKHL